MFFEAGSTRGAVSITVNSSCIGSMILAGSSRDVGQIDCTGSRMGEWMYTWIGERGCLIVMSVRVWARELLIEDMGYGCFSRGGGEGMVLGDYRRHMLRALGPHVIIALCLKNILLIMYVTLYHDRKQ